MSWEVVCRRLREQKGVDRKGAEDMRGRNGRRGEIKYVKEIVKEWYIRRNRMEGEGKDKKSIREREVRRCHEDGNDQNL